MLIELVFMNHDKTQAVKSVATRNFNRPTDMCKFKSSQKDKSRPVGRFLESFYSKS